MNIKEITKYLNDLADAPPTDSSREDLLALMAACSRVRDKMETPDMKILRFMTGAPDPAVLRLAVDMNLFDTLVANNGPITVEQWAKATSTDPTLVRRVVRYLAALAIINEDSADTFSCNAITPALTSASPISGIITHLTCVASALGAFPAYFAANKYQSPTDAKAGPWQHAKQSPEHWFEWAARHPRDQSAFNTTMALRHAVLKLDWYSTYPVMERVSVEPGRIAMVDIGGNLGLDVKLIKERFPELKGRLVFTDLSNVVESAKEQDLPASIEPVVHDFFTALPTELHGAKSYYLSTILHDWPDKQALVILSHIKNSMAKDSVLLISEGVVPEAGTPLKQAQSDFIMLGLLGSLVRTEKQWKTLLGEAGFEVKEIWEEGKDDFNTGYLLECALKET